MITIITPTYNRENELQNLYESLTKQTSKEFVWVVVDDGSKDNTKNVVKRLIEEDKISITYMYQENGGKHTALNKAFEKYSNTLNVCVDSDDILVPTAVSTFLADIKKIEDDPSYIGLIYKRDFLQTIDTPWIIDGTTRIHIPDIRHQYNLKIETLIVIKKNVLNDMAFKTFENEKFLGEEPLYIDLIDKGHFLPSNQEVCKMEYLDEGLTSNIGTLWIKNYRGTIYSLNKRFNYLGRLNFKEQIVGKFKCILNLNAVCLKSKVSILEATPSKSWSVVLFIPSLIWKMIKFK